RRFERHSRSCHRSEAQRSVEAADHHRQSGWSLWFARRVARRQVGADGYTILMLSSTYTINSAVMSRLPFDPKTSFAPVAMLGQAPFLLASSKQVPAKNTEELIKLARAKPGALNYGSAGVGSVNQMAMELLKSLAGLDIKHVPYRAGNTAVNDM